MVITDKIELRRLARRTWIRPEAGLKKLQTLALFSEILSETGGSRSWRKEPFKKYFEEFQAALFTYGLQQQSPNYPWEYSYGESPANREFDCLVRCELSSESWKPVQLKEFVPEKLVPKNKMNSSSLQVLIDGLAKKYTAPPGQEMLVLAIYVNRATTIQFQELKIPEMQVEQLWFYGFTTASNCFIVGNLLGKPVRYDFEYPHFEIQPPVSNIAS